MTYCPVDMDIRNHAHNEGLREMKEMAIEDCAKDILDDFLSGHETSIDERFLQYFEEMGYVWKVVEIMNLKIKGQEEKAQDELDALISDMRNVAGEFADEAAVDEYEED